MYNPDKYIRKAYIDAIESATGLSVFDTSIPKDVQPLPKQYILITAQSKQRTSISKQLWEWQCQVRVDIVSVNDMGYHSSVSVEDIEEIVINTIEAGLTIQNFNNKSTRFLDSTPLPTETTTQSIDRKIVDYEHWLNRSAA